MLRRWTTALVLFLFAACSAPASAPSATPAASRAAADRLVVESDASTQILDPKTAAIVATLPGGVLSPSNDLIVRVEATSTGTAVRGVDLDGLPFLRVDLPGKYVLPSAYGAAPSGFSPNGKWLVLVSRDATDSHFAIIDAEHSKLSGLVDLSARFSFDAIHNDGSAMYLIEHPREGSTTYNVRLYDLITKKLQAQPIFDQKAIARYDPNVGLMDGTFHVSVAQKTGDWNYGLYMRPTGTPFVHALNVPGRYATCIVDLAGTWTKQSMFSMSLTRDGRLLYVVDAGTGSLTVINGITHEVWRRATFAGRPGDGDSRAASAVVSPDGSRLYASAARGIAVLQTQDLTLKQWVAPDLAARSLAISSDGKRVFALVGDAVHVIDASTGTSSRLASAAGARAIHLLTLP